MKNFPVIILFGLLVLSLSCQNDKSTTPGEPAEVLLTSETIGASGGVLETEDFALTIPSGAWSTNASLALYEISGDNTGTDEIVTGVYKLTGIPEDFDQPLHLRIKHTGALEGEHFLAIGLPSYIPNFGDTATTYKFYSAIDSAGFLVGELPVLSAADSLGKLNPYLLKNATHELILRALGTSSSGRYQTSAKHFLFYYPLVLESRIIELAGYFDAAYDTLTNMGFTYARPEGWHGVPRWPLDVFVSSGRLIYRPDDQLTTLIEYDYFTDYAWGNDFNVDGDELAASAEMPNFRRAAGREFTRFVLSLQDWNLLLKDLSSSLDRYETDYPFRIWWHHAVAVWCAGKFPQNGNYIPSEIKGNELIPFTGLGQVTTKTSRNFGYGLAPLIKHLGDKYGNQPIVQTCLALDKGVNPIDLLIENMPQSEAVWWPAFFKKYLQGNIYGVSAALLTNSSNIAGTMNTSTETFKEFPETYPDFSAKLYRIDLDSNKLSDGTSISFEVDATQTNEDYVTTQIYRLKDNQLEFITDGLNITVGGVKEAAQAGYDLIACVVNASNEAPYTESSPLELTIRVQSQPVYNWCRISVGRMSFYVQKSDGTDELKTEQGYSWEGQGSFTGNTFTANYDGADANDPDIYLIGNLSVTLDLQTLNVTSFSGQQTSIRYSGTIQTTAGISGGMVQFHETTTVPNPFLSCAEYGSAACATITSFPYRYDWIPAQYWEEKQSGAHSCTSESMVQITFWKWDGE